MIMYRVAEGTPYTLIILAAGNDYSLVVGTNRTVTKHANIFGVEDIVIDPILFSNNPYAFVDYAPELLNLIRNGYIVFKNADSKNYLMAVRYESAVIWG